MVERVCWGRWAAVAGRGERAYGDAHILRNLTAQLQGQVARAAHPQEGGEVVDCPALGQQLVMSLVHSWGTL